MYDFLMLPQLSMTCSYPAVVSDPLVFLILPVLVQFPGATRITRPRLEIA